MSPLNGHDLAGRILAGEKHLTHATAGTWGVCLACFHVAPVTRHHVCPRAVLKPPGWRPLIIHLCRTCHHQAHRIPNEVLATHRTVADALTAIRALAPK